VEYFNIDWEFSEPAEICSLDYATGTVDTVEGTYPLGNEFVVDQRGFNHILKQEANLLFSNTTSLPHLKLNTLVKKVIYNPHNVTILTDSGDIIEADYAVCTFSLGVLQSDLVQFYPPFPEWKKEALLSFHMTTYTKIFLKFKRKFWNDWQFALYANNATQHGGYYTVWQNLNAPGYLSQSSQPILMVTTTHIESQRIERMSNHQVKAEIQEVLDTMFSNSEPIQDILIPRWHQNPLFRGSYSNWPIGASREHHANMRAPLENRLWFAGEAMSADYYGFLHGAWLEGQSVAHDVLQCLEGTCPDHAKYEYVTGCDSNQMKFIKSTPRFIHQHFS
jgi:polyamine oxidase